MSVFIPLDNREVHITTSSNNTSISVRLSPGDVGILLPGTLHAGGVNESDSATLLFFYVDTIDTDSRTLAIGKQSVSNIPTPNPYVYASAPGPYDYKLGLLTSRGMAWVTDSIKKVFRTT